MDDLGLNSASYLALGVALAAMGVALWRAQREGPRLLNREQELERRVRDLEATVATLQRLLLDKQQELDRLTERLRQLEQAAPSAPALATVAAERPKRVLLAVVGQDPALLIDLAALRDVEANGRFRVTRLAPVTMAALKRLLDRYRSRGEPIEHVHMAVHAGPQGLLFGDGLATAAWLSETLKSVRVLLINGCQSDHVGDWIGVVPTVITMREDVEHTDAALFGRLFWSAVGEGMAAEDAYLEAIRRSPQGIGEFVELHG